MNATGAMLTFCVIAAEVAATFALFSWPVAIALIGGSFAFSVLLTVLFPPWPRRFHR